MIPNFSTLELIYRLAEPSDGENPLEPLTPFGGERELVLALGAEEIRATMGPDGIAYFQNLEHLNQLQAADFITLSLYQNSDTENVLWEYAVKFPDLDIDSDNNDGANAPERSQFEDQVENLPADPKYPGKLLMINDGDVDEDGIPDFADMAYENSSINLIKFTPLVVEIPDFIDISTARVRFYYHGSDPNAIRSVTTLNGQKYTPADGTLRLWKKSEKQKRHPITDYIIPTTDSTAPHNYIASSLGFTEKKRIVTLYIEGIRRSGGLANQQIKFEVEE